MDNFILIMLLCFFIFLLSTYVFQNKKDIKDVCSFFAKEKRVVDFLDHIRDEKKYKKWADDFENENNKS